MSCGILLRLICRLDKKKDENSVSVGLVNRRSTRRDDLWRHSAKKLSQGETHCSRVAQRDRWIKRKVDIEGGKLVQGG